MFRLLRRSHGIFTVKSDSDNKEIAGKVGYVETIYDGMDNADEIELAYSEGWDWEDIPDPIYNGCDIYRVHFFLEEGPLVVHLDCSKGTYEPHDPTKERLRITFLLHQEDVYKESVKTLELKDGK